MLVKHKQFFINLNPLIIDRWIPFTGEIPSNAVEGGYELNEKLFVGKKFHNGFHLIGKITSFEKVIYIPYQHRELKFSSNFDILVVD